ncbi:alpha/beta hydrolase family esterase [Nonomuraea ferruginea]
MTVVLGSSAVAATLVEVTSFGSNPGNMRMHVYVPDSRPASSAIVVAMHGCGGSGPGFYQGSEFASLADRYGFVVIYPTATQSAGFGNCFDTWSDAAKRRGGGSDPVSILSMIDYVERTHQGDPNRVYATGSSSGGMMTQHMLAVYPDVFKAGASFMGVPFNCFVGASDYPPGSSRCTGGSMDRTPQQWGDAVRQAYPGYTGPPPAHAAVARHQRHPRALLAAAGVDRAVDQRVRAEPDPDQHRHPSSKLEPQPVRRSVRHRAGGGVQHPGRRARSTAERHGPLRRRVLRLDHQPDRHHAADHARHPGRVQRDRLQRHADLDRVHRPGRLRPG